MQEATLRDFLLGLAPAEMLASEAGLAIERTGLDTRRVHIQDLEGQEEFIVDSPMLVRLCDAVLAGALPAPTLEPIAFAVIASDHLAWEEGDELVARVLYDWASPEINWELTIENVRMFRGWLTGALEPPPAPTFERNASPGRLISRTTKVRAHPPKDTKG